MFGIEVPHNIGIGDAVQFTSLPENYFRAKQEKVVDETNHWVFDYNPFVIRNQPTTSSLNPWTIPVNHVRMRNSDAVWLSNAHIWSYLYRVPCTVNRPRLYRFEDYPFEKRETILFHTNGVSHGRLPDHVIDHVIKKYKPTGRLYHIGKPEDEDIGIPKIATPTLWDLAQVISECRMFIGQDSGPSWIAACYQDVIIKKIKTRIMAHKKNSNWIPLEVKNPHAHWDDRIFQIYTPISHDVGFHWSYKRL